MCSFLHIHRLGSVSPTTVLLVACRVTHVGHENLHDSQIARITVCKYTSMIYGLHTDIQGRRRAVVFSMFMRMIACAGEALFEHFKKSGVLESCCDTLFVVELLVH